MSSRLSEPSEARSCCFIKKLYRVAIYSKSEQPTSRFEEKSVFNIMNIQASPVMREPGIYYICMNVARMRSMGCASYQQINTSFSLLSSHHRLRTLSLSYLNNNGAWKTKLTGRLGSLSAQTFIPITHLTCKTPAWVLVSRLLPKQALPDGGLLILPNPLLAQLIVKNHK